MTIKISCPGKIILMGEHAVVYGKPAIVAAIDRRMTAIIKQKMESREGRLEVTPSSLTDWEAEINLFSEIPIGVGMGSSAAFSVIQAAISYAVQATTVARIASKPNLMIINETAYQLEKIHHGHPSGVDNTICTYGGLLWFQRKNNRSVFKKLVIKNLPEFVLVNTGKPKETTKEMVENVKTKMKNEKRQRKIKNLFNKIEKQTKNFLKALRKKDEELLKDSIKNCQHNLEELGVAGKLAKNVVREIERIGGAAKISGAGGLTGGSGLLFCYHQETEKILNLANKLNLEAFKVRMGEEGVRFE